MFGKTLKVVLSLVTIFVLAPFALVVFILGAGAVKQSWPLLLFLSAPIVAIWLLSKRAKRIAREVEEKNAAAQQ